MSNDPMSSDRSRAYVDAVRAMLAPGSAVLGAERGGGPAAASAEQAEALAPLSRDLTLTMAAGLAAPEPAERMAAATRLLAKTLTDLEVMGALASSEEGIAVAAAERSLGGVDVEDVLAMILDGPPTALTAERGGPAPAASPDAARLELSNAVEDVFDLVSERATRSGQAALTGLLGLGVGELAGAVGAVGTDLAGLVGQGEAVSRLVAGAARMAGEAANGITALLGPTVAGAAAQQVVTWVDAVSGGEKFAELLAKLYDTPTVLAETLALIQAGPADAERLAAAAAAVNGIDATYAAQVKLAERILQKARFLTGIPALALPQGRLIAGVIYLGLGGYVVLAGADFVDSPRLTLLERAPGIRTVVADSLGTAT